MQQSDVSIIPYYRAPKPDLARLKNYVQDIAKSHIVSNGPLCRELEANVRDFYGTRYAFSCASCTTGMVLALKSLKLLLDVNQCVIPSFTWESTRYAPQAAGMDVKYTDVNAQTWLMLPTIGDEHTVIMPVSVFGSSVNIENNYKGYVLLDAAHAMGTPLDVSRATGAVLSLAPSKIITAGEGGMFITDDTSVATVFCELRDKFGRMSELNAAMGLAHWEGLDAYIRDRKNRWMRYSEILHATQTFNLTNYSTAAFRVRDRDKLVEELKLRGIETRVYYKPLVPGHMVTDKLHREIICLPSWYGCPTDTVLKALKEISESNK